MSDPLSLLRNFLRSKKEIHEEDDKIIFGDLAYPKNVKTNYIIYGTGKDGRPKDYYTLECLVYLIKNRDLQHPMYVKNAGTRNISVVLRPDRRDVLSYLDGEMETNPSVDKTAPFEIAMSRPQTYVKPTMGPNLISSLAPSASSSSSAAVDASVNLLKRPRDELFDKQDSHTSASSDLGTSSKMSKLGDNLTVDAKNNSGNAGSSAMNTSDMALMGIQSSSISQNSATLKEQFMDRIAKKFDEKSMRPITENITQLSDELTTEKIASIKAKKKAQQRKQVATGVEMDDDILKMSSSSITSSLIASGSSKLSNLTNRLYQTDEQGSFSSASGTGLLIDSIGATDDSDTIMREIMQRERVCRTRYTILQSTGRQFDKDINAFLTLIKTKEDGGAADNANAQMMSRSNVPMSNSSQAMNAASAQKGRLGYNRFDQERYAAKDETGGFSIDTKLTYQPNAGAISLTPNQNIPVDSQSSKNNPNGSINNRSGKQLTSNSNGTTNYFQSSQLNQLKPNSVVPSSTASSSSYSRSNHVPSSQANIVSGQKKVQARPIIIIPAARTSIITMINSLDILQELKYISAEEKRKSLQNQNAHKEFEIIIHKREGRPPLSFKVIDNPTKLAPQDWDRVVAVFAQGQQWQFKDWLLGDGNPHEIFNRVKGFHLRLAGTPSDPNIAKWSITTVELDQHKRHLDKARLLVFWEELDRYMLKHKPYLC